MDLITAPGRTLTVHRVTPADAARMRALRLEMLADSPLAFLETLAQAAARPHEDYRRRIIQASTGRQVAQFVADPESKGPESKGPESTGPESHGRLIGHAGGTVLPEEPGVTVVFAVYITPDSRGGPVLGELIEAVAAWSRASGRDELMLEVVVGNDRAVRAYRRLGFAETGVRVPHPVLPALTELQMRRPA
jgi:RimJ/RimL family protein N-acetyltransferase